MRRVARIMPRALITAPGRRALRMHDAPSPTPPPSHRKRVRLGEAVGRLRRSVALWRALFLVTAVVAALLAAALVFGADPEDAVPIGVGQAGVVTAESSEPLAASEVESEPEPAPLTEAPVPGEPVGEGSASYYGAELAGNPTASGERFDPDQLTAAHRTLPLGSRVRVTNVRTGASVVVRINDRGPFHGQRIIDLSREAARQIGLLRRGTGRVRVELLDV